MGVDIRSMKTGGKIFDSSKLKEFADDNSNFDKNGRKFSKQVENTAGKRRNRSLRAISPFPTAFSKDALQPRIKQGLFILHVFFFQNLKVTLFLTG